jgi:hypothetical protein
MRILEFKISQAVVERLRVQINHIEIAAFVFRMTVLAIVRLILVQAPVVALPFVNVGFDVGMVVTEEATSSLARFFQGLMTALTLLLELCMPLDDGAWHHQQIELPGQGQHRTQQQTADYTKLYYLAFEVHHG